MNEKITFSDLVSKIAEKTGSSKKAVHDLLVEVANIGGEGLSNDGHVNLMGLGRFSVKWFNAKKGRNPITGEEIEIPGHNTINYTPTAELRDLINRNYAFLKPQVIEENVEPLGREEEQKEEITVEEESLKRPVYAESIPPEKPAYIPPPPPEKPPMPPPPAPPKATAPPPPSQEEITPLMPDEEDEPVRSTWWIWLLSMVVVLAIAAYFLWPHYISPLWDKTPSAQQKQQVQKKTSPKVEKEAPRAAEKTTGFEGAYYRVQPGERLYKIAGDFYGQSYLWPHIYMANKNVITDPDLVYKGFNLYIPPLQGVAGKLTPLDREQVLQGYVEAYLVFKKLRRRKALYYLWVVRKSDAQDILNAYKGKIDKRDLNWVDKIEGNPHF